MSIENELEQATTRVHSLKLAKERKDSISSAAEGNPHVAAVLCQNPVFLHMFRARFGFDAEMTSEEAADLILKKMPRDDASDAEERMRKRANDKYMSDLAAAQKAGMQQNIDHQQAQKPPKRVLVIKYYAVQESGFMSPDRDVEMNVTYVRPSEYAALWARNKDFTRDLGVLAIRELKHLRGVAYSVYSQFGDSGNPKIGYIHDCAYDASEIVVSKFLPTALFKHMLDAFYADPCAGDRMIAYIGDRLMREIRSKTIERPLYPIVFTTKRMIDEYAPVGDRNDLYKYPRLQGGWTEKGHGYDKIAINYKFIKDLKSTGKNTPTRVYKSFNNEGEYMTMLTDIMMVMLGAGRSAAYEWLDDRFRFLIRQEDE